MSEAIKIPEELTKMLQANAELINRLNHESGLLLTGFLAGQNLDKTKKYEPNNDFTELNEVKWTTH